ncbi:MarR family winged helix-turn-helix transcriptional regulator [Paenibacillus macquariensis]|uniref:MarR family protein n=2 Tax=Paenibacillus macquariensis TaxID=948756 RepID=A0ABY1KBR8_9BACL|nr:MarR family transcriptional regulator [Paenibacillus macquariensis]OAB29835.1 hypothetical protein PMSM_23105 [Paenibacillus macquariensis subsp. macquariensis]SIR56512.1 MarR family protein [Paenibacillus macquariensis]
MIRMRNNMDHHTEQSVEDMDIDSKEQIRELLHSFNQVKYSLFNLLRKNADALGTTFMQYHVLRTLHDHPDIGLSELADFILLGNSTTSGVVDRLVKSGLVSRKRLESDRRSVTLRITDEGDELQDRMERAYMQSLSPLNQLNVNDRQHLLRIQHQMNEILQQQGEIV